MARIMIVMVLLAFIIVACAEEPAAPPEAPVTDVTPGIPPLGTDTPEPAPPAAVTLTVMTHDSFAASEEVIRQFEIENNAQVQFLFSGDTGTTLNRAILAGDTPLADVLYGVDNTFLSRALEEEIFEPYESALLAEIPEQFQLDPENRAHPVDYGDVCLNYDINYFEQAGIDPPQSLEDLLDRKSVV